MQMHFKATRKASVSHSGYRQILKYGDLDNDGNSDDVINLRNVRQLVIDCNKKTGEFRLQWEEIK